MTQEARLNVRIDKQLLREVRIHAIRHGTNLSHIVRDFLTHYIQAQETGALTPTSVARGLLRERQACKRITAVASHLALDTVRGPIGHKLGYWAWHFTTPEKRGRIRCTFRNHLTGETIPDKWELIWIEEPLERQPLQHQHK